MQTSPVLVIAIGAPSGYCWRWSWPRWWTPATGRYRSTPAAAIAMLGPTAIARTPLEPEGQVMMHGELWRAEAGGR